MALRLSLSLIKKEKKKEHYLFHHKYTHWSKIGSFTCSTRRSSILNLLTLIRQMQQASALYNGLVLEEKGYEPFIYNIYKFS